MTTETRRSSKAPRSLLAAPTERGELRELNEPTDNRVMAFPALLRGQRRLILALGLCVAPVLVFYGLLFREARPFPMYDDYHAILAFALDLRSLTTLGSRFLFIAAAQHDEYKLVIEHLLVAADLTLTGRVHFGFLMFVANVSVLGLAALFWKNSLRGESDLSRRLLLFAPALFLLFQLNYTENLDWAMCGLQTMPVLLFSLATVHFAIRSGAVNEGLTAGCALAAALSSANGFLIVPVALFFLLRDRRFRATLLLLVSFALATGIFLYHRQPFNASQAYPAPPVLARLLFCLSFLGGAVENMHHQPVPGAALVLGTCLLLTLLASALLPERNSFLLGSAVWCLLTAVVVAQGRSYLGTTMSLTGRYKIYSDLLLVCTYLWLASWLQQRRLAPRWSRSLGAAALVGTLLFAVAGDLAGYRFLEKRRKRTTLGLQQYQANPQHNAPELSLGGEPFAGYEPEYARQILTSSLEQGLYVLPDPL